MSAGLGLVAQEAGANGVMKIKQNSYPWPGPPITHARRRPVLLGTFVASTAVRCLLLLVGRSFGALAAVALLMELLAAPVGVMADASVVAACAKVRGVRLYSHTPPYLVCCEKCPALAPPPKPPCLQCKPGHPAARPFSDSCCGA